MPPLGLARLEDRVALGRAAILQVPGHADAAQAGADDDDVEVLHRRDPTELWFTSS